MATPPDLLATADLSVALRRRVDGEVRFDPGSRHLHAGDASNHRHVPLGVVTPRTTEALVATVATCREHGVPVTVRGAGTSLAGQATNRGVIVDVSRHLDRILALDPAARTAVVEPGVVLASLQRRAAPHGLRFGPDPSTSNRCTIGGMLGNDACGPHSLRHGRTSDNVIALDVALADGTRLRADRRALDDVVRRSDGDDREARLLQALLAIREDASAHVAALLPTWLPRLVSGLHLDRLCLADAIDLAGLLVGSEGRCATTLTATLRLVDRPEHVALALLGFPSAIAAADAVPALLTHAPEGLEGFDHAVVDGARRRGTPPGLALLPAGAAWLVAEVAGATPELAEAAARRLADDVARPATILTDPAAQAAVWAIRRDGLGAASFLADGRPTHPGWEDAAVPPAALGAYLRGLQDLLDEHGLTTAVYGHFGDGCVHTKIDFDHTTERGRHTFRTFVEAAADLTVTLGGSLSGEHGDGQARGELLERMFGPALVDAFRRVVRAFDPDGVLNPGRLVDAAPLDADLRDADLARRHVPVTAFDFAGQGGPVRAFDRCVGAGTCRRDDDVATMCPSYRATHDEQHSTRGRARLLGELLRPDSELAGFDDPALVEALELCLSCKACTAECPVEVDLPTLKAEAAHQRHDVLGVPRPRTSRLLGSIRPLLRSGTTTPALLRRLGASAAGRMAWRAAGFAPEREPPLPAATPFRDAWRRRGGTRGHGEPVVLFVDTFTDAFAPEVAASAVRLLERRGRAVEVVDDVCCGRPRITEGMLTPAREELAALAARLDRAGAGTAPIVWLEPSCRSVVDDELPHLHRGDEAVARVRDRSATLAEFVVAAGWDLSTARARLRGRETRWHPHCHHRAGGGTAADARLLDALGLAWRDLDAGCCGLAGGFGFVAGERHRLSLAVAEERFAPRLRALDGDALVLMDGFSCREQSRHLALPVRPRHLAELLDAADR